MSLLNTIKAAQLHARKERDAVTSALLTTLIGDAVMVGKNNGNRESTDSEVIATIKKFITNTKETLRLVQKGTPLATTEQLHNQELQLTDELEILERFLPKQLSLDELNTVVEGIIAELKPSSIKDMGKVMKVLKERYDGAYDGALASNMIKIKLTT